MHVKGLVSSKEYNYPVKNYKPENKRLKQSKTNLKQRRVENV